MRPASLAARPEYGAKLGDAAAEGNMGKLVSLDHFNRLSIFKGYYFQ